MLPLENLDKKKFKEILMESKRNIQKFTSEWTDENYHDPGITFLEMFSWITEMQRYYLNKIPKNNHYKFLELYGVELESSKSSFTYVFFSGVEEKVYLPKGLKLLAEDQVFETEKPLVLTDNSIEKIMTFSEGKITDKSYYNFNKELSFHCFGKILNKKNRLCLGFNKAFTQGDTLDLLFNIFEDYPVPSKGKNLYNYGVTGSWYSYSSTDSLEKIECVKDTTEVFGKTGIVTLKINKTMEKSCLDNKEENNLYWIIFEVEDYGAHISPKILNILLNTVKVKNINRKAIYFDLIPKDKTLVIEEYLSLYEKIILQYYLDGFWIDLNENQYSINKDYYTKKTTITLMEVYEKLRVICIEEIFKANSIIGSSNGLPNQEFDLVFKDIRIDSLVIQAGKMFNGKLVWKDFVFTKDLILLDEVDYGFSYDALERKICFGNGEKGAIPYQGKNNLRIIKFSTMNRDRGNVKGGEINKFLNELSELKEVTLENIKAATGGSEALDLEDGRSQVLKDFKDIHIAVTKEDYESLLENIPGIRIAASKAIIDEKYPNSVKLVAVPYMEVEKPMPDTKLINIIKAYFEDYRLITTKIQVIKPVYIEIGIKCIITTEDINGLDKIKLKEKISDYLSPVTGDKVNFHYKIGETVYISDLFKIINKHPKVKYVNSLWMDGKGQGVIRDKDKNIILPENGICCCGNIEIDLTD